MSSESIRIESKKPNRRKSVQLAQALAALAAVGGSLTACASTHHEATSTISSTKPSTNPQGSATTTTEVPSSSNSSNGVVKNLCEVIPRSVILAALDYSPYGSQDEEQGLCSLTATDAESAILFSPFDLTHAQWGGPNGTESQVTVSISSKMRGGRDSYAILKKYSSGAPAITVAGYQGLDLGAEDVVEVGPDMVTVSVLNTNTEVLDNEALKFPVMEAMINYGFTSKP